ncbi:MAG: GNAT family N-acetyltransferase [Deltaproteobacteria bacterium]|jgi:GNAT superfamily N-acetyltransferase|nr:GNAT family N-acetyltransferase [Deltaproteobacteria bacterium]
MICTAEPGMLIALRRIWKICFGDSDTYLEYLFNRLIRPENLLAHIDRRGRPDAMLCMQKATLEIPGNASAKQPERLHLPCSYIYGVATLPEHRGRGISSALLQTALQRQEQEGAAASVLVPSSPKLAEFYAKRGYENFFFCNMSTVSDTSLEAAPYNPYTCELFPANLVPLARLRQEYFGDSRALLTWSDEFMACIDGECLLSSGETLRFRLKKQDSEAEQEGYVVCYRQGSRFLIKEYAGPDGIALNSVLTALHKRFKAEEYLLYLRADKTSNLAEQSWNIKPFGMLHWFGKPADMPSEGPLPYLAHALD